LDNIKIREKWNNQIVEENKKYNKECNYKEFMEIVNNASIK
jgi:hypothetical protein